MAQVLKCDICKNVDKDVKSYILGLKDSFIPYLTTDDVLSIDLCPDCLKKITDRAKREKESGVIFGG